jgi:hypothetical protein
LQVAAPSQGDPQSTLPASQGIDGFLPIPLHTFPLITHIETGLLSRPIGAAPVPNPLALEPPPTVAATSIATTILETDVVEKDINESPMPSSLAGATAGVTL